MKNDVKYVVLGVLIFALAMGFTLENYKPAKAAGREDPLVGFHYGLSINGQIVGYFTEVNNLGSENEIGEQKVINDKGQQQVMKMPGRLKFHDVTLKRGITTDMYMFKWRQIVEKGDMRGARRQATIVMYDQSMKEIAFWNLNNAWPSKLIYNPVDASAMSSSIATGIESIVITSELIERVK